MRAGKNRRLANVKTRTETGLEYILSCINLNTPFGKKQLKEIRPYFPGEEEELRGELDKVQRMIEFAGENPRLVEQIEEHKNSKHTPVSEPVHKMITPVLIRRETTERDLLAEDD